MFIGSIERRRFLRSDHSSPDRFRIGVLEPLEERVVMAALGAVTLETTTALSPQVVKAGYQVVGSVSGPITLDVYRSATASYGSSSVRVGQLSLQASDLSTGAHDVDVPLTQVLDIDPSKPYVLTVAQSGDPSQPPAPSDSAASFRIWTVGAVTHGYQPTGQFPSWVQSTADALKAAGYDATVAFNWAALSAAPAPGAVPLAAQQMTAAIGQAVAGLHVPARDVVDVHLIGHSRGGDVVSLVAGQFDRSTAPLAGGYLKLTLLDPHPARNDPVAYYSSSNGPIGTLTQSEFLAFQAATNDPPLVIPAGVDRTEIFYQQTTVPNGLLPDEHFLMSWGAVPAGGATAGVVYYNLTGVVDSHEGIHDAYLQQIVPLLATGAPVPFPPSPVPTPPTNGGPAFPSRQIGTRYETQLFRSNGVPAAVTTHLLRSYNSLNLMLARRRFGAAGAQITRIERFAASQSGRGIPAYAATYLQGQLELARVLLFPHAAAARSMSVRAGRLRA